MLITDEKSKKNPEINIIEETTSCISGTDKIGSPDNTSTDELIASLINSQPLCLSCG